jgi:hypothetical protein
MKKSFFIFSLSLLVCGYLFSQPAKALSEVASLLFRDVKTKLTIAEKNQVAAKLGFIVSGNKEQPFALDADSKEFSFPALVLPSDMNKDGKEEIFVVFGNSFTSGHTGSSVALFIKNTAGEYRDHLGFPGMAPDVLATARPGYPDLLIGGPGFEYPVWKWDGKAYKYSRNVKDKDYDKLKKTNVTDISIAYQQSVKN